MHPVLHLAGLSLDSYAVFTALAFLVGAAIRRVEVARLGYAAEPGHRWVSLGALLGAVVGTKLGMLLFVPPDGFAELLKQMLAFDFSGKTVVGGLAGGFVGVELTKRLVGITRSTGDAFAVAIPVGQGIGRIGCFLHGCCFGAPSGLPFAAELDGVSRHPAQLYESVLDFTLAAALFAIRKEPRPEGHLFRYFLVGYALIRIALDALRGDPVLHVGPFTLVQLFCAACAVGFTRELLRDRQRLSEKAA